MVRETFCSFALQLATDEKASRKTSIGVRNRSVLTLQTEQLTIEKRLTQTLTALVADVSYYWIRFPFTYRYIMKAITVHASSTMH